MIEKISLEAATEEINKWLDKKKIVPSLREIYKGQIDILIEAVSLGILTLNENGEFTQELLFPLEGEINVKTIPYKARLNSKLMRPYLKGVASDDGDARMLAYLACLTGQPKGVMDSLDSADKRIANSIVVFFAS